MGQEGRLGVRGVGRETTGREAAVGQVKPSVSVYFSFIYFIFLFPFNIGKGTQSRLFFRLSKVYIRFPFRVGRQSL